MADLGAIGTNHNSTFRCATTAYMSGTGVGHALGRNSAFKMSTSAYMSGTGVGHAIWRPGPLLTGKIEGLTKVNGVIAPYHAVHIIDRRTGQMIGRTYSDSNGYFVFKRLQIGNPIYFVVMIQQSNDPGSYNAAVFDKVSAL